jgi:putative ABC transport system permease protein
MERSEIRQAFRQVHRRPGASAAIIATLTLAIGANTAIFSLLEAAVLRPLPFEHAGRLLWIVSTRPEGRGGPFSVPELIDYRAQVRSLDQLVAYGPWNANLTGGGHAERLQGLRMSANAFEALGVRPARGRLLSPADDAAGAPRVAVLGHALWLRRFGGADGIVGQALRLNGESYLVVGVLPRRFPLPQRDIDVVVPLAAEADPARDVRSSASFLRFIGRLAPGADAAAADRELDGIAARLRTRFPVEYARSLGVGVSPLHDELVGDSRRALLLVFAAVLLVLGIAGANVVNLLLARAVERRREIAVRIALGASRGAILRQLLVEGALHAVAGGLGGVLLAIAGVRLLVRMAPAGLPRLSEATVDAWALGFTALLTVTVAVLAGAAPAGQTFRLGMREDLMSARTPLGSVRQQRRRGLLVVVEVALAVALLVASASVAGSLARLQRVDLGFATKDVLVARVSLPRSTYTRREHLVQFYDRFAERVRRLPGVQGAGLISVAPLSGHRATTQFTVEGRPPLSPGEAPDAQFRLISPGYREAAGMRLLRGRDILETDREQAPAVVLVNEALAERFLGPNPLGQHIRLDDSSSTLPSCEVVGVVGNVRHTALEAAPTNDVYLPWAQARPDHVPFLTDYQFWAVRAAGDPQSLGEPFRRELGAVDPEAAASQFRSLEQHVDSYLAPRRFSVFLMGAFAGTALILAMTGLYAVMAYAARQQAGEIAVRLAVGARPIDIYRLVLGRALGLVAAGIALGLGLCLSSQPAFSSLLFETSASEPQVLLAVAVAVTLVALASTYAPARRAARTDPMGTLRGE